MSASYNEQVKQTSLLQEQNEFLRKQIELLKEQNETLFQQVDLLKQQLHVAEQSLGWIQQIALDLRKNP